MAGAAARSSGQRKFSLLIHVGLRRKPAADQPGAPGGTWLDRTIEAGQTSAQNAGAIDYEDVYQRKLPLIVEAARIFLQESSALALVIVLSAFCAANSWWLEDFVLFDVLRERNARRCWKEWPRELASRQPAALDAVRKELASEINLRRVIQFFFFEQWHALRLYCAQRSIRVVGDIAIFVDHDSADVWSHRDLFRLRKDNFEPEAVSGVPPDAFSATGQRWGSPLYDWDVMKARGYDWWIDRLRWATQTCDYIRLDHFRGFEQFWEIPANEPTAVHGRWVDGPKDELFNKLREALGGLPFFAEDLGYITPEVHALRERHQIPGIAVLQFGFGDPGAHVYLPHRLTPDRVVYTGTHDNDTTLGWWKSGVSEARASRHSRLRRARATTASTGRSSAWRRSRLPACRLCPLQDVLGLGSEARLNTPSVSEGNFRWRYQPGSLTSALAEKLAALAAVTDRLPSHVLPPPSEDFVA